LAWYAKVFPVGWPRWYCHDGTRHWILGQPARAVRSWRRALRLAERFGLPLETAQVHLQLGRAASTGSPEREEHLTAALRLFEQIGAAREVGLVGAALVDSGAATND
jgi:hypothetical protein